MTLAVLIASIFVLGGAVLFYGLLREMLRGERP